MELSKNFLKFFIMFIVFAPVTLAFAPIQFNTETTIYRAASGGIIFLEKPYYATQATFSNGFLMFSNFNYGTYVWGSIGFSCQTENANMTLNVVRNNYLKYTVDAPTSTTSITKIYLGNKGTPTNVVGADSFEYNYGSKTLTVSVSHSSPQEIELEWNPENPELSKVWIKNVLFPTLAFAGIILVVMTSVVVMNALSGNVDTEIIKNMIVGAMVLIIAIMIGSKFI